MTIVQLIITRRKMLDLECHVYIVRKFFFCFSDMTAQERRMRFKIVTFILLGVVSAD